MKKIPVGVVVAFVVGLFGLPAQAQDVTVSESQWFEHVAPPETLATLKSRLRPVYPERLEGTVSGYVILRVALDAKGKRTGSSIRTTNPEFQRSVEIALLEATFKPAVIEGKPAASNAWFTVIFNAANASPKKPDAQPRLLAAMPVILAREFKKPPGAIWATVTVDEKGVAQKPVLEDASLEEFAPELEETLKAWKFAPARKAGGAIAAETRVGIFVVAPSGRPPVVAKGTPPKVIHREPAVYPPALRRSGIVGEVLVGFEVDVKGNVVNVAIVRSNNPGFEPGAIACVSRWKFDPALEDGKPVARKMQMPIIFTLNGGLGREAVQVKPPSKEAQQNIPAEYRYDVAPKARAVVLPVYPYALLRDGVKGKASITALIDGRGRVTEIVVMDASQPAFGQALAASFAGYSFDPAMREGKPTATLIRQEHVFGPDAGNDLTTEADLRLLAREKKKPETIVTANRLDLPLKPTVRRPPDFPGLLYGKVASGEATVEFLVDEDGHARLPRVVSATEEAFGFAAVQAIATWQFEAPLVGGKPAVVRAQVPVKFGPKPPAREKAGAK